MTLNVGNCPSCGKVFAKGARSVCPACHIEIERQFVLCEKYLRENRGASLQKLADETEVTIKQITKFIKDGRISMYNAPNVFIPCDVCGQPMKTGMMCDTCRQRLTTDVAAAVKEETTKLEQSKKVIGFQSKDRLKDV